MCTRQEIKNNSCGFGIQKVWQLMIIIKEYTYAHQSTYYTYCTVIIMSCRIITNDCFPSFAFFLFEEQKI